MLAALASSCSPQGCGKTTIVEQLEQLFNHLGMRAASVSIDDFYLSYPQQNALAEAHPGNALLQLRGNAGTHDLALGAVTLQELKGLSRPNTQAAVPRCGGRLVGCRLGGASRQVKLLLWAIPGLGKSFSAAWHCVIVAGSFIIGRLHDVVY